MSTRLCVAAERNNLQEVKRIIQLNKHSTIVKLADKVIKIHEIVELHIARLRHWCVRLREALCC